MDESSVADLVAAVERPALGARLKEWAAIFVMLSSAPALALIFTATSPVMPMIAAHFGAGQRPAIAIPWLGLEVDGTLFAQMITTLPSIGLMLGGAPTGFLIDRLGTRRVLIGALLAYGFLGSAGLYVDDALLLLASRFGLGFAAVGFAAATISLIGSRFVDEARARALSYRQFLGGVGGMIATVIAGQVGEVGWHAPFALFLAVFAVVPLAVWAVPAIPAPGPARGAAAESLQFLWPVYLLVTALAVVMMMNTTQLAFLLVDNGISSPALMSRVIVMGSVMSMAGSFLYSVVGPKVGMRWNYSFIAAALGGGVIVIGLSHDAAITRIGVGLTGLGAGYMNPHFARLVLDRAPPAARGRAVGLNFSAIYFGDLINPLIVRPIAATIGIHRAFTLIGLIVAASALQIFTLGRTARRREKLSS